MVKLVIKKATCIFKETNVLVLMTLVFYTKLLKILQYIQNCNKCHKTKLQKCTKISKCIVQKISSPWRTGVEPRFY